MQAHKVNIQELPKGYPTVSVRSYKRKEESRFTRRWNDFGIRFDGDVSNDVNFPDALRAFGFPIGANARGTLPGFKDPTAKKPDFSLARDAPARKSAIELTIELPKEGTGSSPRKQFVIAAGANVGAVQKSGYYDAIDHRFEFLPFSTFEPGNASSKGS